MVPRSGDLPCGGPELHSEPLQGEAAAWANFLFHREDLLKLDFSKVFYYWDNY